MTHPSHTPRRIIPIAASSQPLSGTQLQAPPPLSLYVHFPWCAKKCPYCDFNSHAVKGETIPETQYIDALLRDLEQSLPSIWGRRVVSIFIGGGTPSLMSAAALDRLLSACRTLLPLEPAAEITLEANPGTVEAASFPAFRDAGITRLSMGIQSFNDQHLQQLGRIHNSQQAHAAIEQAARHFDTWNIDLMYALPQQTLAQAQSDLATALTYAPPHLSCYHLTLEPNTLFHRNPPKLPDEDQSADMQEMIEHQLAQAGYEHYETSAFASKGQQCRHNLNYWSFGDYLGIGAGAHGKLSSFDAITRQVRHKHPQSYLAALETGQFIQEQHSVGEGELPFEFMMNALRLTQGVSAAQFSLTTGLPLTHITPALTQARQKGLLDPDPSVLRPTALGRRFLNDLLELFLPVK